MIIDIKKVENVTGYKVKKNFVSVGFDTAKRTGICFIKTNAKEIEIDWMFLEFKDAGNKKEIYKIMVNTFANILNKQNLAVIEEVFVGFSRAGSLELAKYGTFAIAECIKKNIDYEIISATTARSKLKIDSRKFGKGKSKKAVAYWLKENLNLELNDEDVSDATILCILGILENMDFRSQLEIKNEK